MRELEINEALNMVMNVVTGNQAGGEFIINDSLHFGLGLYVWAEDMMEATEYGVKSIKDNGCFSHLQPDQVPAFLKYLIDRDGFLYLN